MAFKINISLKGKTYKLESENEFLVGKKIGETFKGDEIDNNLDGYELTITGTSDLSGIPGFKDLEGSGYHRRLLTFGKGMKDKRKGIRLRKTNRGEEISMKTHQINIIVNKEGDKKFDMLIKGGDFESKEEDNNKESEDTKDKPEEQKHKEENTEGSQNKEQKPEETKNEEKNIGNTSNKSENESPQKDTETKSNLEDIDSNEERKEHSDKKD